MKTRPSAVGAPPEAAPSPTTARHAAPASAFGRAGADASTRTAAEVARALGVDPARGLAAAEAARRLAAHGRNELRAAARVAAWRRALEPLRDPLVALLLAAIAIALVAWWVEGRRGWPVDAIVIAVVVLLNTVLGHLQQAKAENAVAALARMTQAASAVWRDGQLHRVPSAELVPGDVLVLAEGDAVGADARLLHATSLQVQQASLTGESHAVPKGVAVMPGPAALADRANMVFKGTAVVRGSGRGVVTATGMATEVGQVATLLDATAAHTTPLQREVARIGRLLGIGVVVIAAVVVATILALAEVRGTAEVMHVLLLGVSLAVAAVPEGLPAILSVVLALGVQRMARHHAVVKQLASVETLGSTTVICTDKTGTLTRSEMTIERIATASGETRVSGVGYAPPGELRHAGAALAEGPLRAEQIVVLGGGSLAGNAALQQAENGAWQVHGDPTEAAFLVAERKLGAVGGVGLQARRERRFERVGEVAFTSERKLMSTLERDHAQGDALVLFTKGAPDVLLGRCTQARVGSGTVPLDAALRARLLAEVDTLSDAALRTLAVAYRPLTAAETAAHSATATGPTEALEHGLVFAGTVGMLDPPREEAAAAIAEAHRAGIRVIMITGDHPRTAARIAAALGIVGNGSGAHPAGGLTHPTNRTHPTGAPPTALTGLELDALDPAAFAHAVRSTSVFARVSPAHKLRIVAALQADRDIVAMTGDGVNDAPALKAADIGIAMGVTGTEVTKEAAKMILADDNFATIVHAVREGRGIFDNIRTFLRYLLSSNMGEVLTVFLGVVGAGVIGLADPAVAAGNAAGGAAVLPLLATQILWVNLVTDSGPALALGVDPPSPHVMDRRPRRAGARVIDAAMVSGVLQLGVVMAFVTLATIDLHLPGGLIAGTDDLATARTAGFTTLVLAQLFNCFNARSETRSAFERPFVNAWLWGAIALSAALQVAVVHVGVLNTAFGTVPLGPRDWLVCIALASAVLWYSELRKFVRRARRHAQRHPGTAAATHPALSAPS